MDDVLINDCVLQALTIRLQQEVNEKEAQLEQAYSRLDSGEAPDEASAKEWTRMLQINELSVNRNIEVRILASSLCRFMTVFIYQAS